MARPLKLSAASVLLLLTPLVGVGVGIGVWLSLTDRDALADMAWSTAVLLVRTALLWEILRGSWRGEIGLDLVAAMWMTAALVFGGRLAAAVVAPMHAGGTLLAGFAEGSPRDLCHPAVVGGE